MKLEAKQRLLIDPASGEDRGKILHGIEEHKLQKYLKSERNDKGYIELEIDTKSLDVAVLKNSLKKDFKAKFSLVATSHTMLSSVRLEAKQRLQASKVDQALEYLKGLMKQGYEYPDASAKACLKFRCDSDELRDAYDELTAKLTPKQKQLDINGDGKISSDDLKRLRKGEKPVEAGSADLVDDARQLVMRACKLLDAAYKSGQSSDVHRLKAKLESLSDSF